MIRWLQPMTYERPHRSGVLAAIAAYVLLWTWGYAIVPHDFNADGGFSLTCWIAPWECPAYVPERLVEHRTYNVTHVVYCPACPVRKKHGGCREYARMSSEPRTDGTVAWTTWYLTGTFTEPCDFPTWLKTGVSNGVGGWNGWRMVSSDGRITEVRYEDIR